MSNLKAEYLFDETRIRWRTPKSLIKIEEYEEALLSALAKDPYINSNHPYGGLEAVESSMTISHKYFESKPLFTPDVLWWPENRGLVTPGQCKYDRSMDNKMFVFRQSFEYASIERSNTLRRTSPDQFEEKVVRILQRRHNLLRRLENLLRKKEFSAYALLVESPVGRSGWWVRADEMNFQFGDAVVIMLDS